LQLASSKDSGWRVLLSGIGYNSFAKEENKPMTKSSQKITRQNSRMRAGRSMRSTMLWIGGIGAALVGMTALIFWALSPRPVIVLDGVNSYSNLSRAHSEAPQTYTQTPPVGGVHSAAWQNCGIYDQPVRNENAVHSLEHGAVWITYRPDLPQATIEVLRNLVRGHTHVLLSPYPDLPKPVVASAWGSQLPLDDATDPRLALFVTHYEKGPQTPEPGAVCNGGVGTPLS
jgi:hypothetical protein